MASILARHLSTAMCALLAVAWLTLAGAGAALADGADEIRQGIEAFKRGNTHEAIDVLTRAIDSGDLSPSQLAFALKARAYGYLKTGRNDPALADLSRLLQLDPDNGVTLILRAEAEYRLMLFDAARADLDKALEDHQLRNEDRAHALVQRGGLWYGRREYERALADFELALQLDPDPVPALLGRAMALRGLGRFDEAIRDFEEVMKLDPDIPTGQMQRGETYYRKRDFKRAIEDFDNGLARGADAQAGQPLRALAYYNLRQFPEAVRDLDAAIAAGAQDDSLVLWRYFALLRAGDTARADAELDRHAIRTDNPPPGAHWPQVVYQFFIGKADSMEVQLGAAFADDELRRKRQTCEADFYVGEFAAIRGQAAVAKAALKRAMTDCPIDSDEHVAAETTLAQLGN